MNIVHLTTHMDTGGVPVYVRELSRALSERGHHVCVLSGGGTLAKDTRGRVQYRTVDVRTRSELNPKLVFAYFRIKNILKKYRADIIHTHTRVTQLLGHVLSTKLKIAHVTTCHGLFHPKWARKTIPLWGDCAVAISHAVKDHMQRELDFDTKKIRVVPTGIDTERFDVSLFKPGEHVRDRLHLVGKKIIGIIARLSDVKGHRYLIEAFGQIAADFPDTALLIVGRGREEARLREQVQKLSLAERVIFVPHAEDTREYLNVMDIFALPSLQEGLGLSACEAMAMGVPVLASNVGGLAELLDNGKYGTLVEGASAEAVARGLRGLLEDSEGARKKALLAQDEIKQKHSLSSMASEMEKIYQELVG